jgi:tetratricopeptide (TPR) repeat protein
MPQTINGIGTRYAGRKNAETRAGVCEHCGRTGLIASYDTRLWFCVLFIPVIPLERKRVLDQCPACTRHRVMPLAEWDRLKRDRLTESTARLQASPNDPEAAIELHAALTAFGQHAEAGKVQALIEQRFPAHVKALAYLAGALEYQGKSEQAAPLYERVLQLDANHPQAREAVGLRHAAAGRVDEARKALRFLEAPDCPHPSGALFTLAQQFQLANRHREALELFTIVARRLPEVAQDKKFRKTVLLSEKAVGQRESVLPAYRRDWRKIAAAGAVVVLALAAVFGSNLYIRGHRAVHVVNGFTNTVRVEVAGAGAVDVSPGGRRALKIAEGRHRARWSGGAAGEVEFEVRGSFLGRWFDDPVWILNPGGAALLVVERTTYSKYRTGDETYGYELLYAQPFLHQPQVDYPFEAFPSSITLSSRSSRTVEKTRVDYPQASVEEIVLARLREGRALDALRLAEWRLRGRPDSKDLLRTYYIIAQMTGREAQARAFFAEGVRRRPVEIQWHRMHQESRRGEPAAVTAEYDELLRADPGNSALLYLRGRLAGRVSESQSYYERALAADARNAYAWFALGSCRSSLGDWTGARAALTNACRLEPGDSQFRELLQETRVALGEHAALEAEARAAIAREPFLLDAHTRLCDALLAQGRKAEAALSVSNYTRRVTEEYPQDGPSAARDLRMHHAYAAADFATLEKLALQPTERRLNLPLFQAHIEQGALFKAAANIPLNNTNILDGWHFLTASLAWQLAENKKEADAWHARAIELLRQGRDDERVAADLLDRSRPPELAEAMDLSLPARTKAIFLAALAQRRAGASADFAHAIRKLNVPYDYPYHLLERAAAGLK